MSTPILVLNTNTKREHGRQTQLANVAAAKSVADIIRTTLGPRSMLKMILDPMGGIVMTNDGNAILREIDVSHPAAKSMIELSRTQDEEVGDGTTSVIILAGELLIQAEPFIRRNIHPRNIVGAYIKALDEALAVIDREAKPLDISDRQQLLSMVKSTLGTKFVSRFGDLIANLAIDAVLRIASTRANGVKEIDIKKHARVEKIPGGMIEESVVLDGIMLNKDIVHPQMRRKIVDPKIILLDGNLEYKKGESQTNMEFKKEEDFETALKMEEEFIESMCKALIKLKPDLVVTEKGVSDLAQHYLQKAGISVMRRVRKTDNVRIARACGAVICSIPEEVQESDIGSGCGLFEVRKIGDEYFSYMVNCKEPKACSIVLRGASKDVLNEIERNLMDAMCVVRNIILDSRVVPGGGAIEMAIAQSIQAKSKQLGGVAQWPFRAVASALEIIPRTLIENCGGSAIRLLTALRTKHAESSSNSAWGIDGNKGELSDMNEIKVWDSVVVKSQTIKTAIEAACMLLRIDDIVAGLTKKSEGSSDNVGHGDEEETFGDARDG